MGPDTLAASSMGAPRVDRDVVSRFATCCRALGLSVHDRQRPADLAAARSGFAALTHVAHEQCDAWTGLAAAGDVSARVIESVWRTSGTAGVLQRQIELAPGALGFSYDTGPLPPIPGHRSRRLPIGLCGKPFRGRRLRRRRPPGGRADRASTRLAAEARWLRVAICYRTERWSDVVRLLTPVVNDPSLDETYAHAARVTLGIALARLGMFAPALSYLEEPAGPVAVAAVDGALRQGALPCARRVRTTTRTTCCRTSTPPTPRTRRSKRRCRIPRFGLVTTTAARIDARTNPWDPGTEPTEADFVDPGAKERKAHLLIEAEAELAEFIGLEEVKYQVARLKSSVAMAIRRQERGLTVAQRTNHLVFAGPPGTGKTTIARVVAKIYCGLGLLKKETVREVHRADLIGQHIGETEAKTNAIIDSALDGVLFLDEAYALVSTGAKNDFGLVAIDTLLARMENDRDRLVVIVAGYRKDLDLFLDTNEGLRSRFTRSIDFPSYSPSELVEIAVRMAEKRDSVLRTGRPRPTWKACSHTWPSRRRRTPPGCRAAAWTSRVTAGSSATSSNAPRKSASTASTIPTQRISPTTS